VRAEKLQPIAEVVQDLPPLPSDLLELARFVAGYYQEPLGLVLAQVVPPVVRAGRPNVTRLARTDSAASLAGNAARTPWVCSVKIAARPPVRSATVLMLWIA
jgi:primosomal protein N' (replication factor Y)